MPLDLVVPDLLSGPLHAARFASIERAIVRADLERVPKLGLDAWIADAFFGLASPAPVAALTLAADEAPLPGAWLRADPVHLRIAQDAVSLHDSSVLDVTREEADALCAALQEHFAVDGMEFRAPHPERWYVRVPAAELPRTTPLPDAVGRNVFGLLPRGDGRINWRSAITEAQMVLASHPLNGVREASGQPAINSVWFWGEGPTPESLASRYALIAASSPLALGAARIAGVRTSPLPARAAQLDAVAHGASALMVDDRLSRPLRAGDEQAWLAAATELDETTFADIGVLAERFDGVRIVLPAARDTLVATISPRAKWRWLRARKPLASHA